MRRAARAAVDAAESERRIGLLMQTFSLALAEARRRNEVSADRLRQREKEIVEREAELRSLLERFAALGDAARELSTDIQKSFESGDVESVALQIARFLEDAARLGEEARERELLDLARDVQALRKQIQSARNKLGLRPESIQ
jgi:hypothetical protein